MRTSREALYWKLQRAPWMPSLRDVEIDGVDGAVSEDAVVADSAAAATVERMVSP